MLEQLDKELEDLQTQLLNKENDLNATESEIERDQNAIEFLSHTIATTKRNQRLLIKRQNLMKTRKSLEQVSLAVSFDAIMKITTTAAAAIITDTKYSNRLVLPSSKLWRHKCIYA